MGDLVGGELKMQQKLLDEVHDLGVLLFEGPAAVPVPPLQEGVVMLPGPVSRQVSVVRGRGIRDGP